MTFDRVTVTAQNTPDRLYISGIVHAIYGVYVGSMARIDAPPLLLNVAQYMLYDAYAYDTIYIMYMQA